MLCVLPHIAMEKFLLPSLIDQEHKVQENDKDQYPHADYIQAQEFHNLHGSFLFFSFSAGCGRYQRPVYLLLRIFRIEDSSPPMIVFRHSLPAVPAAAACVPVRGDQGIPCCGSPFLELIEKGNRTTEMRDDNRAPDGEGDAEDFEHFFIGHPVLFAPQNVIGYAIIAAQDHR